MHNNTEVKTVFIGEIAFNTDIVLNKKTTSIGGAAYYCAVGALAANKKENLKSDVGIVAPVGGDFDISYLTQKDIDIQGVSIIENNKTCRFTAKQHPDNTRTFTAERNVSEIVNVESLPLSYLEANYLHLATSLPENYLIWINFLSGKRKNKISADAFELFSEKYPQLTIQALNQTDLIFLNEAEANILSNKGHLRTDIPWILKKGPGGVSYIENGKEIKVPAPKVNALETSGAGDTLAGAFLTLLANNYEIEPALIIATNIASHSVTKFGVEHLL